MSDRDVRHQNLDLESALADAADMASLTVEYIGRALRFDGLEPPQLSREDCELLSFAVPHTRTMVDKAKAIFHR